MLLSVVLSATFASAQPRDVIRDQITLRGTVEAIDLTARTVTIRGDRGNVVTIDVPQSVARFDQLQVGDVVSVAYYDRVSVRPKPAGEPAVDRTEPPVTTTTPGALPGATVASQRVTTVTITGWDPATRVVTFTGPTGAAYSRRLLDTTDASIMAGLKVGDRVDVTRTEAVRLAVESAHDGAGGRDLEDFRNRLTISVLWGWDNQFSGNMIQAATGQTTTGVPINLNETTYDDVYGRMGIFKVGAGYRTSPRTRSGVQLRLSRRARRRRCSVGTAGAANVPLYVNFDDYSYWGFEGGQRFFFTRVRFTPFVGYLVGLNRYGDIRGTFVDVPLTCDAGTRRPGRQVLREVLGVQPGPHRRRAHRPWPDRADGRDAAALHGRAVGRRLARRGGPARHQQRELALVVSDSARRQDSVLMTSDHEAWQGPLPCRAS